MLNVKRMILSADDEEVQLRAKMLLIQTILNGDILEFENEIELIDAWDDNEGCMGKAFSGVRDLIIRIRDKAVGEDIEIIQCPVIKGCSCFGTLKLAAGCSHNSNLESRCAVELCPRLSKQEKKL